MLAYGEQKVHSQEIVISVHPDLRMAPTSDCTVEYSKKGIYIFYMRGCIVYGLRSCYPVRVSTVGHRMEVELRQKMLTERTYHVSSE